ncbi:hypothetical protein CHU_0435 [Cytophaga hutchinsonii ATCC 33406]|uniref:Uncharacterized protein n=1 Tax=Cytophaga hutchinsonii (strain ATCC 33406 / DSM 1761 / CIP 103989 / NBRC 15051 / NCIMB 9469 / D465) TaxID=269798 RepID=A0A6N4SN73_CYTH3|nr:hypothetical protein CHU_0435 [Cytophaga hutchinsonii ATCC 33406]
MQLNGFDILDGDCTRPDDTLRYVLMIRYTDRLIYSLFTRYQTSTQQLYLLRGISNTIWDIYFKNT